MNKYEVERKRQKRETQRKEEETAKTLVTICSAVEKGKQRTIKRIVKRLNAMSPNDISFLARIIETID